MKYIKYLFALICVFSITLSVKALDIPAADVTYDTDWEGTLDITENKTDATGCVTKWFTCLSGQWQEGDHSPSFGLCSRIKRIKFSSAKGREKRKPCI